MNQLQNTNSPVILIADDDRDILSIIETILQEDGYQTLTASDGEQAVMLVQTHAVQLLILDIMMPKMNGLQAATQIRRLTNAPILMLSAKGEQSDRVIGLNRLKAIHLNDSKNPCGAHKDRHEQIGKGYIGLEALMRVVNHPTLKHLPFELETPNDLAGYAAEIKQIRELAE